MPDFVDAQGGGEYFVEVSDIHVCVETKKPIMLVNKDSLGSEKHIPVDPSSLKQSGNFPSILMFPASTPARRTDVFHLPPLNPPTKPRFLSYSLPNSASSSPKFGSMMSIKKSRNQNQVSPVTVNSYFRQDSIALANLERLRETHIRRSKSCGEGRTSAPPEELDLLTMKSSLKGDHHRRHYKIESMERNKDYSDETTEESYDDKVKCGALCLFLPGFTKAAKPVRSMKEKTQERIHFQEAENTDLAVSKRVSLEKFECGSWRSSVILDDPENQKDTSSLFFDLPLEMIRCSANETHSPVTTAFVFDKDRKGVPKKSSSRPTSSKKSTDSSRHVRFSTSSPASCPATPTTRNAATADDALQKAREDLNSFLAVKYLLND